MILLEGRSPALPIRLALADGAVLELRAWLRVLPDRRYVARAVWQGREVLAKVFVGHGAERRLRKEQQGVARLVAAAIDTPALLCAATRDWGSCLLFEYLDPAPSLRDEWQHQPTPEAAGTTARDALLAQALATLGRLHRQGLWHGDLHLGNLLHHAGKLYVIDGDAVVAETSGQPLPKARALAQLGRFLSEAAPDGLPSMALLVEAYGSLPGSEAELLAAIRKARNERLDDYLKKIQRDCSDVKKRRTASGVLLVNRRADTDAAIERFMADPDAGLAHADFYKRGNTAWVMGVPLAGRQLVLKRYNMKGFTHWLNRCWRPSRAWQSWVNAHALLFLGVATPLALAVKEKRYLWWLRGVAWLLLAHGGKQDILARWQTWRDTGLPPAAERRALVQLLTTFWEAGFSHGDLKGHNLLWQDGRWQFIDLDAMTRHRRAERCRKAQQRDRARFLRNWPATGELHRWLDDNLPKP